VGDCLDSIEQHPKASKWDHLLAGFVRLLKVTEETGTTFAFDDMSNMPSLSEPRTQLAMIGLQKSVQALRRELPWDIRDNGMFSSSSENI
jgi:hypothetical protein